MYITITEVARSLRISTQHLAYWIQTGRIPSPAKIGSARVYTEQQAASIKDWYAEHLKQREERRRASK